MWLCWVLRANSSYLGPHFWTATWILALAIVTHLLRALAFVIVVTLLLKSFLMLAPMHTFHAIEYQVSNVSHTYGWGSPGLWGKYKEMSWIIDLGGQHLASCVVVVNREVWVLLYHENMTRHQNSGHSLAWKIRQKHRSTRNHLRLAW